MASRNGRTSFNKADALRSRAPESMSAPILSVDSICSFARADAAAFQWSSVLSLAEIGALDLQGQPPIPFRPRGKNRRKVLREKSCQRKRDRKFTEIGLADSLEPYSGAARLEPNQAERRACIQLGKTSRQMESQWPDYFFDPSLQLSEPAESCERSWRYTIRVPGTFSKRSLHCHVVCRVNEDFLRQRRDTNPLGSRAGFCYWPAGLHDLVVVVVGGEGWSAEHPGVKRQTTSWPHSFLIAAVRFSAIRCQRGISTEGRRKPSLAGAKSSSFPPCPSTMAR